MQQYLTFLKFICDNGIKRDDRTGTGTLSVFGYDMRFNLNEGFPIVTTKKIHLKSVIYELLWFLKGDTNIQYLNDHGVSIWNEWADERGDLGNIYGKQWRSWSTKNNGAVDQISNLIADLQQNPHSRRHIVCAWNVGELDQMVLPPCHCLFQFYVANNRLSCKLTQRSADVFLGVPFNIMSYALLTHMIANICNFGVGEFIWSGGDCHLYLNHLEQVKEQLSRKPYPLPQLEITRRPESIFDFRYDDFVIHNYQCHPRISAPIAV